MRFAVSADPLFWAVLTGGHAAGWLALMDIQPENAAIELGNIWFSPRMQRTRAATEAMVLLLTLAADTLGYRRLVWKCNALNAASRRAAERLGFTYEGTCGRIWWSRAGSATPRTTASSPPSGRVPSGHGGVAGRSELPAGRNTPPVAFGASARRHDMQRLIDGYRRFRDDNWPERRRLMQTLALEGQSPIALVIACADSRADPAMIFDAAPGELFVVRNVANLVPPFAPDAAYHGTSAALEFGVRVLQIPELIVLGHANCGGIRALMHGTPDTASDFVAPWISIADPSASWS